MSQDEQLDQEPSGTGPRHAARAESEAVKAGVAVEAGQAGQAARRPGSPRREFTVPGDGAPRYAATSQEAPRSGSEDSWSAQPNPGYQPDPAINYPTKRLVAGALVGALLMAGFAVYAARILTNRSGNGNGSAPWTASVARDGAVVGGINAPNNGAAHEISLPAGTTYGQGADTSAAAISKAVATCRTATDTKVPVSTATGTTATIGDWAVHATPSVQSLRTNARGLQTALTSGHVLAVANAANTLCAAYPGIAALHPMPDAVGSQAWSSAASALAAAATESLRGASGNPDAAAAALDNISKGEKELDALSARIVAAT